MVTRWVFLRELLCLFYYSSSYQVSKLLKMSFVYQLLSTKLTRGLKRKSWVYTKQYISASEEKQIEVHFSNIFNMGENVRLEKYRYFIFSLCLQILVRSVR